MKDDKKRRAAVDSGFKSDTLHKGKVMGADDGINPEQLFAATWAACFIEAMQLAAVKRKITPPEDEAIETEIEYN